MCENCCQRWVNKHEKTIRKTLFNAVFIIKRNMKKHYYRPGGKFYEKSKIIFEKTKNDFEEKIKKIKNV